MAPLLLSGDGVRLPQLTLIRPTLYLEVSSSDAANWILGGPAQTIVEAAAAPGGELGNLPQIHRLEVEGTVVRLFALRGFDLACIAEELL
ncbi:hypothetical protein CKO31_13325 [Thiohalocapsa halophila]|uniref:CheW-like domain-containing protein n=1 Tax=Thiohalocapsa halophila TaxID=69359 RepID=A0ABS1CIH5_9GAMM|nr:hypothetical protein [Thiohalocapsa halophila]MBK1631710.1 hypothetical protein [Thiohalocapsa halophila]